MIGSNSVVNANEAAHEAGAQQTENQRPGKVTRQIFVTGGVASSLGKGLTASSLGMLLRARGLSVTMQKLDPYLNVDPGTMNPFQHGEVFVTDDGAETDLDIGHYERFLDENLDDQPDIIITEIGGTVGDIESQPFLEAARQVRQDVGRRNVFYLHVSLIPYIGPSGELKTKPTQHSVAALRGLGIQPDALVLRSDRQVPDTMLRKIGNACDVDHDAVISCPDAPSIYDIPRTLHSQGLDTYILDYLGLDYRNADLAQWERLLKAVHEPSHFVTVAMVGKYIDLPDAYLSVSEALRAGGFANDARVKIKWVASDLCETPEGAQRELGDVDAICVPGGFGIRGIEGKLGTLRFAREHRIPTLGLCLGLQCMVIEFARSELGLAGASSTEFEPETAHPVVATMDEQKQFVEGAGDLGGTMRLGLYDAQLRPGSVVAGAYGSTEVKERHRHRYEVNNEYRERLEEAGLVISGTSPGGTLVEFVELPADVHPYYVGTQAHPELMSRPTRPHPLFDGLVKAALERREAEGR